LSASQFPGAKDTPPDWAHLRACRNRPQPGILLMKGHLAQYCHC
jgi:hypothetical protein